MKACSSVASISAASPSRSVWTTYAAWSRATTCSCMSVSRSNASTNKRPSARSRSSPNWVGSMKLVDEYRDAGVAHGLRNAIAQEVTRPWVVMEVCGGQTHALVKYGIDQQLAELPIPVELVHGPGCPVCVTPIEMIDRAHAIAARRDVTLCTFGDMLRVPGSTGDLLAHKARGADVKIVYSPLEAVEYAAQHPTREVVLFAIGFETTAPATASAAHLAKQRGVGNFSLLVSHVL